MIPCSIGWRMDVVFGGKNAIWTLVKFKIDGCAGQVSMIRAIFWSTARNFRSSLRTHSSKISLFILLFFCDLYSQGRILTFLEQWGFLDFEITNMGSFSPVALAAANPVSLTLLFFSPERLFLCKKVSFDEFYYIKKSLIQFGSIVPTGWYIIHP